MTQADRAEDLAGLAVRAKAGDRAAFEALVRAHKAGLYAFARRYVGDPDEAYDIVQEAFIAAWRAMGRFDPRRPFDPWLKTIALNKCRDHGRRAAVRRLVLAAFAVEPAPAPADDADEDAAALRRLDQAIARLPAAHKEALLLTTTGGLSHADAGRTLGITAKAVEMRVYKARRRLAEVVREEEGGAA